MPNATSDEPIVVDNPPELNTSGAAASDHNIDTGGDTGGDLDLSGFADMGLDIGDGAGAGAAAAGSPSGSEPTGDEPPAKPAAKPAANPQQPPQKPAGAQKPIVSQPAANATRSKQLEKVAPHLRQMLGQMSNSAFNHFYPIALKMQNGELVEKATMEQAVKAKEDELTAQLSNARYYDHERGYTLTDEHQQLSEQTSRLSQEAEFWADQLEAIDGGQPFRVLLRDAQGNIRVSEPYDPKTPGAKAKIHNLLTRANAMHTQSSEKLATLPERHKAEYSKYSGFFGDLDKQLFGKMTDQSSKTYNKAFVERAQAHLQQWPAMFRGRPEVRVAANSLAVGELLINKINQLQAELQKTRNHGKALQNGSPSPDTVQDTLGTQQEGDDAAALATLDQMAGLRR